MSDNGHREMKEYAILLHDDKVYVVLAAAHWISCVREDVAVLSEKEKAQG